MAVAKASCFAHSRMPLFCPLRAGLPRARGLRKNNGTGVFQFKPRQTHEEDENRKAQLGAFHDGVVQELGDGVYARPPVGILAHHGCAP